jgi:NAD(P)H-dependent flavin oxidoreductase YrpB (nitropropane dioxygenase family)
MFRELHTVQGLELTQTSREFSVTEELTLKQVAVVLEERVPLLVIALGDPAVVMDDARAVGTLVAGLAGSPRNAERQLDAGVDIVIAQGSEAGGHTGTIASMPLIPQVVRSAARRNVPVVAAGGIATGAAIAASLALGAQGVWCGTAFLFAEEVNLHFQQREQLRAAGSHELRRSRVYTGKPSRMFENEVIRAWQASGLDPLPMPHQRILMDDFAEAARAAGRFDLVSNPAGQIAGLLDADPVPAAEIVARMVSETRSAMDRLRAYDPVFD